MESLFEVPSIVISGVLTLPDDKPPIKRITSTTCMPRLVKSYSPENKTMIIVRGTLTVEIEYTALRNQDIKSCFVSRIPYGVNLNSFPILRGKKVSLRVINEHQEFTLIEERKIKAYIRLKIVARDLAINSNLDVQQL